MTALTNSILVGTGNVLITGTLNDTLKPALSVPSEITANANITLQDSQSTNLSGVFYVNIKIKEYLEGKGLDYVSFDNRGCNFQKNVNVMLAWNNLPDWMREDEIKLYE